MLKLGKARNLVLLCGAALLHIGANTAVAGPAIPAEVTGTACDAPPSPAYNGSSYTTYVDCGTYYGTSSPNDPAPGSLTSGAPLTLTGGPYPWIATWDPANGGDGWAYNTGYSGFSMTGSGSNSGTWDTGSVNVLFVAIKAGNDFSIYGQNCSGDDTTCVGATSGLWATAPTLVNVQNAGLGVSHLAFYGIGSGCIDCDNEFTVPEPGALGIIGLGLLGLGLSRRRLHA